MQGEGGGRAYTSLPACLLPPSSRRASPPHPPTTEARVGGLGTLRGRPAVPGEPQSWGRRPGGQARRPFLFVFRSAGSRPGYVFRGPGPPRRSRVFRRAVHARWICGSRGRPGHPPRPATGLAAASRPLPPTTSRAAAHLDTNCGVTYSFAVYKGRLDVLPSTWRGITRGLGTMHSRFRF